MDDFKISGGEARFMPLYLQLKLSSAVHSILTKCDHSVQIVSRCSELHAATALIDDALNLRFVCIAIIEYAMRGSAISPRSTAFLVNIEYFGL